MLVRKAKQMRGRSANNNKSLESENRNGKLKYFKIIAPSQIMTTEAMTILLPRSSLSSVSTNGQQTFEAKVNKTFFSIALQTTNEQKLPCEYHRQQQHGKTNAKRTFLTMNGR